MRKALLAAVLAALSSALHSEGLVSPLGLSMSHSRNSAQDEQLPPSDWSIYGVRLAFISGGHRTMVGLAAAGIANDDAAADGYVGGVQTAAIFNTARDGELALWQVAGVFNSIKEGGNGIQVSAFCNEVGGYFNGAQIALVNRAMDDFVGLQVGVANFAGTACGLQIGLVNTVDSLAGVQIGVWNFVKTSRIAIVPVIRAGW